MKSALVLVHFLLSMSLFAYQTKDTHPSKTPFLDSQTWQATQPGQVTLAHFVPFRAEYERRYNQGAGPKKGQLRIDRVVIVADFAGWDGRKAINATIWDSAHEKYDDTNGRLYSQYFAVDNLELLYEMGPIPGKGKDYYTLADAGDQWTGTIVMTGLGTAEKKPVPLNMPAFGAPAPWIQASMALSKNQKVRLDPALSFGGGVMTNYAPVIATERNKFKARNGQTYTVWVLESVTEMNTPWVKQSYVIKEPPYLIKRTSINKESGEENVWMELIHFQAFK